MSTVAHDIITPIIGEEWPEQGGVYVGSRMQGGVLRHLIMLGEGENDIEGVSYTDAAAAVADMGMVNGHAWRVPTLQELTQAWALFPESFKYGRAYWSSSPFVRDSGWALVVNEQGCTATASTHTQYTVRPMRLVVAGASNFAGENDPVMKARRPQRLIDKLDEASELACAATAESGEPLAALLDFASSPDGLSGFAMLSEKRQGAILRSAAMFADQVNTALERIASLTEEDDASDTADAEPAPTDGRPADWPFPTWGGAV